MGRVIITFKDGHKESFKCPSKARADIIAAKRPSAKTWDFYEDGERIPLPKKKEARHTPRSLEELEELIKMQGLR